MTHPEHSHIDDRLTTAPPDRELPQRLGRLNELGLGTRSVREFDELAQRLAKSAGADYAMVNFINDREQFFAGLYAPTGDKAEAIQAAQASVKVAPDRTMPHDHGYCPHVIARKLALVLDDVCASPRFGLNPVVSKMQIRSYLGAPLIDPKTGVALGTVCAVSTDTSDWGRSGVDLIKSYAAEVIDLIGRAERRSS